MCVAVEESVTIKEYMYDHLQELMEDIETYGWKVVRDYHAAWLQLMEQGRVTWGDTTRKEKLRHLMVWSKPALGAKQAATTGAPARQQPTTQPQPYRSRFGYIIQPSNPGDKACMSLPEQHISPPGLTCMRLLPTHGTQTVQAPRDPM